MSPPNPVHRSRRRFPPHIEDRIKKIIANARDNWHALLAVLWIYGLIAAFIGLPYLADNTLGWWLTYLFVSLPALGCWQRALATMMHESSKPHQTLAKNPWWNYVCGSFLSGYVLLQSWIAYSRSHLAHHVHLGDEHRDPDLQFQLAQGTYAEVSPLRFAFRYLIAPLLLVKTPTKIWDLIRHRLLARPATRVEWLEQLACILWFSSLAGILVWMGLGLEFLLFWLVPLVTTFPMVGYFIELAEHFPHSRRPGDELYMSRNRWTDPVTHFFTGQLNEHLHQVHHLNPTCPFWALPLVHEVLMQDSEYRATQSRDVGWIVPVIRGVPSIFGHMLKWVADQRRDSFAS